MGRHVLLNIKGSQSSKVHTFVAPVDLRYSIASPNSLFAFGQSRLSMSCSDRPTCSASFQSAKQQSEHSQRKTLLSPHNKSPHMVGLLLGDAQLPLVKVWDQDPIPGAQARH